MCKSVCVFICIYMCTRRSTYVSLLLRSLIPGCQLKVPAWLRGAGMALTAKVGV